MKEFPWYVSMFICGSSLYTIYEIATNSRDSEALEWLFKMENITPEDIIGVMK